jgi:hypothetical protein
MSPSSQLFMDLPISAFDPDSRCPNHLHDLKHTNTPIFRTASALASPCSTTDRYSSMKVEANCYM